VFVDLMGKPMLGMGKPMLGMGLFMCTDGHYVRKSSRAWKAALGTHADHAAWVDCAGKHVARPLRKCVDATTGGLGATGFCNRLAVTNMCAVVFGVRPSLDEIRTVTQSIYECVSVRTRPLGKQPQNPASSCPRPPPGPPFSF